MDLGNPSNPSHKAGAQSTKLLLYLDTLVQAS